MNVGTPALTTIHDGWYCVDHRCPCHDASGACSGTCKRCRREGTPPLTIVSPPTAYEPGELEARIRATHRDHGDVLQAYHRIWYESGHTWVYTHFLGVGLMKNPNDLWVYQDLIASRRPKTIIETGTYAGGSALWFAFLQDVLAIEGGRVITVDIDDHRRCTHPRVTYVAGSSVDPAVAAFIIQQVDRDAPILISLDADHSAAHVQQELDLYAPITQVGDWIVVEDTNIGWEGPHGDLGARGGLAAYLRAHPGEFDQDITCERYLTTMHPGGWLRRVAPHRTGGGV